MRKIISTRNCLALLLPATLGIQLAAARTLIVGQPGTTCPGAQYSTIAAAVAAAAPYDDVQVCPAVYPEQLVIAKPLTLEGVAANNGSRTVIQPTVMNVTHGSVAVITVENTVDVIIRDLVIDAGLNTVSGCNPILAGVQYLNASGTLSGDTIQGATLQNGHTCPFFSGNGYGALIETDGSQPGPFAVAVTNNSFHDFTRDGILAQGSELSVDIESNSFSGPGPGAGSLQFGVFIDNGPFATVSGNVMTEGTCGSLPDPDCIDVRSEGVAFNSAADGSVAEGNTITNAQYGIFLIFGNRYRVMNNSISNIDAGSGIQLDESVTNSIIQANTITHVNVASEGCGIFEPPLYYNGGNNLIDNRVNDAYCGIASVPADTVQGGVYLNTVFQLLDSNLLSGVPAAAPAHESASIRTGKASSH